MAKKVAENGVDFIVIGDVKSPPNFNLAGCDFWSIERQRKLGFQLAKTLPERHYARKNLGYLIAMERGAEIIIETDDDNFPKEEFWQERSAFHAANLAEQAGWINVYRYFTDVPVWPRGFPLEYTKKQVVSLDSFPERESFCPIQQGLADGNPDVDAVYRLVMPLPVSFSAGLGLSWAGRPGLLLIVRIRPGSRRPSRSFTFLHIVTFECVTSGAVLSRSASAGQTDGVYCSTGPRFGRRGTTIILLDDFQDEVVGYINNARICEALEKLDIKTGSSNIGENMRKCYQSAYRHGCRRDR